jgi:CRP/FNR family cyclic AMP-dependent transcriptional regulator
MTEPLFARYGREYAPGDVLFVEGEAGDVMYVIQSGTVRITKQIHGEEKMLAVLGPGEFVGEMAILNGKPRNATAAVLEPARCLVIEARMLESMLRRNAEIAIRLIKKLAKRLDSVDALVGILMHRDPRARVMLALARHADAFGEETPEGIRIRTSPEEIAREVDADEDVVHEVMARLRRLKLVKEDFDSTPSERRQGGIVVSDIMRLREFLEFIEMPQRFGGDG